MLREVVERYLRLFAEAAELGDTSLSLQRIEEMRTEFQLHPPGIDDVIQEFDRIASQGNPEGADIYLAAAWGNLSEEYTPSLCNILKNANCQHVHEAVLDLLVEVGTPYAIPYLKDSLEYNWDYDEWLNVPRKSLQVLACIGTSEAIAVIKSASSSSDPRVRNEALDLLED